MLFLKCPRCHEGDFLVGHPYRFFQHANKVKERCPKCDLKYSLEPSFYYGAMYVSYSVGVAVAVAVFVLIYLFKLNFGPLGLFLSITIALISLTPYISAISKSIWANLFFKYDEKIAKKVKENS